jgi:periplasmic copper chaperone A
MKNFLISSIFFTGLLISNLSTAHVVFTDQLALAGSYYKGTLRVGHGCGDESTTAITVKIPAGFEGAKPQPKFGWKLSTKKELLVKPYNSHGKTITEDVVEIRWEATSKDFYLPNEQFDEFSFFTHLPNQPGPVWVNIKQECVKGVNNWADVPTSGTSTKGIKNPAALLELLPSSEQHNH